MSLKRIVAQFCVAVELLTRIPMPQTLIHKSELSFAVWAYPVVGIFVGLWGGLLGSLAVFIGLPMSFAACIAILGMTLITGGLHEDGLADTVDALGGIRSVPEMLRIMKDSTLGTYGVLAIAFTLMIRGSLIAALPDGRAILISCIVAGAVSRSWIGLFMSTLPLLKQTGIAASIGRPPIFLGIISCLIAVSVAIFLGGIEVAIAACLVTLLYGWYIKKKIGGYTGDIIGAGQQLTEAASLCFLVLSYQ